MKRLLFVIFMAVGALMPVAAQQADDLDRFTFAWGAQVGGSIDLSGQNMSSIDFSGGVGVRYKWIKLLGVGVGANIMASNDARSYPIYATLRTDFLSHRRGLVFLDTRFGIAVNQFPGGVSRVGAYTFTGVGINLATGRHFASYLSLGYTFCERGDVHYATPEGPATHYLPHLHLATAAIGIVF